MSRSFTILAFLVLLTIASASCPGQCKPGKAAKKVCRKLPHCKVVRCRLSAYKYGRACVEGKKPPRKCSGRCQKKKAAKAECGGRHDCILVPCSSQPHKKLFRCVKPGHVTTAPPTTTTTKPELCQTCPFGEFQAAGPGCRCVNRACDACPDGSLCRRVESSSEMERTGSEVSRAVPAAGLVQFDDFICVSCECGYCDASADACCGMVGANCKPRDEAQSGQCMYGDFDILGVGEPGWPTLDNVCMPTERLGLKIANDLVESCGCVPNAETKCVVVKNTHLTNCRVPRL